LGQPTAHREVLKVVLENIGLFTLDQQSVLLESTAEKTSIVRAFALAIDRDPVSVLVPATRDKVGAADAQPNQQGQQGLQRKSSDIEYEALVTSLALCAANVGSPELFGAWENSTLLTVLQSSAGSLGSRIAVDAWVALAGSLLPRSAVLST
ncbi:hypothetical protein LPJ75_003241, partial [Coemansia sp. RSA 2598]